MHLVGFIILKASGSIEMSVNIYQSTRSNIPEDQNHGHCCRKPKYPKVLPIKKHLRLQQHVRQALCVVTSKPAGITALEHSGAARCLAKQRSCRTAMQQDHGPALYHDVLQPNIIQSSRPTKPQSAARNRNQPCS